MDSKPFTTKELESVINALKSNNSQGYDDISTKIQNVSSPVINLSLNYICNKTFSIYIFPVSLKYSVLKQLHKNGNWHDIFYYRLVSFLTSFSKKNPKK